MTSKPKSDPVVYDRWYQTPRGRWVGERETALVLESLQPRAGESLLDVGCGTGYFTRALAAAIGGPVTGVDVAADWLEYARRESSPAISWALADATALPYAAASFDCAVAITSLCFVADDRRAVRELCRVARRRVAVGLLNRHSLLWWREGRGGGHGGYRGAHWHTAREALALFDELPVRSLQLRSAIQLPSGGRCAEAVERSWPRSLHTGAFLLVTADIAQELRCRV